MHWRVVTFLPMLAWSTRTIEPSPEDEEAARDSERTCLNHWASGVSVGLRVTALAKPMASMQ